MRHLQRAQDLERGHLFIRFSRHCHNQQNAVSCTQKKNAVELIRLYIIYTAAGGTIIKQ